LPAFLAFFLAGFFLAMWHCRKNIPRLHEKSSLRRNIFSRGKNIFSGGKNKNVRRDFFAREKISGR
jgi:hypothetical protein